MNDRNAAPSNAAATISNRYAIATISLLTVCAVYSFFRYWSIFGGDPEIHIIFAKNLLAGYPLQFNQGEYSSGETSPAYMALVALMELASGNYAALVMKLVGLLSILGVCGIVFVDAYKVLRSRTQALAFAALYLLLPSTVLQALLGMENALFAFLVVLVVHLWLSNPTKATKMIVSIAVIPLLFLLRPEAVLLAAALGTIAVFARDRVTVLLLAAGIALTMGEYLLIQQITGVPLQAAGQIRAVLSSFQSLAIGIGNWTVYLNPKPLVAVAYLGPFALLLLWRKTWLRIERNELIVLLLLVVAPFLLHVFSIFPSVHFSRYFMYAYAVGFYIFARVMVRSFGDSWQAQKGLLVAVALMVLTIVPFEQLRRANNGPVDDVRVSIREMSDAAIADQSNSLYHSLGNPKVPVVIGVDEVQLRGRLDNRFVIRSLDGIVDYRLKDFVRRDWIDHLAYIRARQIGYLFAMPNYNGDRSKPSLADIALGPALSTVGGLCFQKLDVPEVRAAYKVWESQGCH